MLRLFEARSRVDTCSESASRRIALVLRPFGPGQLSQAVQRVVINDLDKPVISSLSAACNLRIPARSAAVMGQLRSAAINQPAPVVLFGGDCRTVRALGPAGMTLPRCWAYSEPLRLDLVMIRQ